MFVSRYCLLLDTHAGLPAAATPSPEAAADLERNRQLLQKWKAEPEHYARLQRDLHDFWELSDAKRGQLRQLDHALHQLEPQTRKRLWKVAERYLAWLEGLPEDERRHIEETKDAQERLRLIRTIRERQWIERLPRKVQADLDKLPEDARSAEVARLRIRNDSNVFCGNVLSMYRVFGNQLSPIDLRTPGDLSRNNCCPRLTPEEKQSIQFGAWYIWPNFPRTVKELANIIPCCRRCLRRTRRSCVSRIAGSSQGRGRFQTELGAARRCLETPAPGRRPVAGVGVAVPFPAVEIAAPTHAAPRREPARGLPCQRSRLPQEASVGAES